MDTLRQPAYDPHEALLVEIAAGIMLDGVYAVDLDRRKHDQLVDLSVAAKQAGDRCGQGRDPDRVQILFRSLVDLVDEDPGPDRRPLHGTTEQVLEDLVDLRARGVTEVFVDLNFSPRVVAPDVDAVAARAEAERVLDALAPVRPSG